MGEIFEEAAALRKSNTPFAFATIVESEGSTPRKSARMIVLADRSIIGTIGGGKFEGLVIEEAVSAIGEKTNRTFDGTFTRRGDSAMGMDCGGRAKVFIEVYGSQPKLLLVGGGHVNKAVADLAAGMGFAVSIAENRREFSTEERFPFAAHLYYAEDIRDAIEMSGIDEETYVVIATNHEDTESAIEVLRKGAAYAGLMGSKRKISIIKKALRKEGYDESTIDRLYAPIGLDIGAESPVELAVSILAELLKVKNVRTGESLKPTNSELVVIRGGGDIATGVAWRLHRSGIPVCVLETASPTVVRRQASFAAATFGGEAIVEGVGAVLVENSADAREKLSAGIVPVLVDPGGESIPVLRPGVVIDAIMAKRNLGTTINMAPLVIGLGPGFTAGTDVHAVIETNRGPGLGRVLSEGQAEADTGIPGEVGGYTSERVIRATADGVLNARVELGQRVRRGDELAEVGGEGVFAEIDGIVRGLIYSGSEVSAGMKIGDIDPRGEEGNWKNISDKALAIGGGVLEAVFSFKSSSRPYSP